MGSIHYRAVHTKSPWRKVNSHKTLKSALDSQDGAVGLFARKVRINYETHGDPLYVFVWEDGAQEGYLIIPDMESQNGVRKVSIPMDEILAFDLKGGASEEELRKYL
jgi:5-methylcytosine-specific restriction protein A